MIDCPTILYPEEDIDYETYNELRDETSDTVPHGCQLDQENIIVSRSEIITCSDYNQMQNTCDDKNHNHYLHNDLFNNCFINMPEEYAVHDLNESFICNIGDSYNGYWTMLTWTSWCS